jgi:hypothetical protein
VHLVREFIKTLKAGTKRTYNSKLNVLMKLLCKKNDDNFMCIYTLGSVAIIKKKYKNITNQYINFMLGMVDKIPEIKERVSVKVLALLKKAAPKATAIATAVTYRKNEERNITTDYDLEYTNLINKDTSTLNEMEKLVRMFYIDGIYDKSEKLKMIPRNYLFDVKIITNIRQNDKINNFYIVKTGKLIINDFKTNAKYEPIVYILNSKVKDKISENLKKDSRDYLFGYNIRDSFNKIISKSLGVGVDNYRRIMKRYHQKDNKYSLEYLADVMRNSVTAGIISY